MRLYQMKAASRHGLSIADQLVVSGANFLMLLAVTRWAGVEDAGYYAVALSVLFLITAAQDALVTRPLTVQLADQRTSTSRHAGGSLAFAALFVGVVSCIALLAAAWLTVSGNSPIATTVTTAMAIAIPPFLLREFARRYCFATFQTDRALVVDVAAMTLSILGMIMLSHFGKLTAATALAAIGIGNLLPVACWIFKARASFSFDRLSLHETMRKSFTFGKWLLLGQLAMQARSYATHWITFVVGGAAVTGLYAACLSVIAISNPIVFGYYNGLTPMFVRTLKEKGPAALCKSAALGALFLGTIMSMFTALIYFQGAALMNLLFPGEEYSSGVQLLNMLAISAVVAALGGPALTALIATENGKIIAFLNVAISIIGFVLVSLSLVYGGIREAAIAVVLTELFGTVAEWTALFYVVQSLSKPRAIPAAVDADRSLI